MHKPETCTVLALEDMPVSVYGTFILSGWKSVIVRTLCFLTVEF